MQWWTTHHSPVLSFLCERSILATIRRLPESCRSPELRSSRANFAVDSDRHRGEPDCNSLGGNFLLSGLHLYRTVSRHLLAGAGGGGTVDIGVHDLVLRDRAESQRHWPESSHRHHFP